MEKSDDEWRAWAAKVNEYSDGKRADPGPPPGFAPFPEDRPADLERVARMGSRVAVLLLTLWTLGGALAGSLVIASPADYPGDLIVALGTGITLVCTGLGIRGLLWATTTRITNG